MDELQFASLPKYEQLWGDLDGFFPMFLNLFLPF
jgi:hypothetical protein